MKLRVQQISSHDHGNGKPGKQIIFVEDRPPEVRMRQQTGGPFSMDLEIMGTVMEQFKSALPGLIGIGRTHPKIIMFLTEQEYDLLGLRFEVNEIYDLKLEKGSMTFAKSSEGI